MRKHLSLTITNRAALSPPNVKPVNHDPRNPLYGFHIDEWAATPTPEGSNRFLDERTLSLPGKCQCIPSIRKPNYVE
jgi:hypothetical protein